ncbi:MAG TPA: MFS transporter, partial [Candidatus Paceibacterota bacterium]|nr:MFS transporter [Candidatus Paceibacterota bacterium]
MSLERNITLLKWHTFLGSLCFYAAVMFIYYVGITESYALAASVFSISLIAAMVFEIPTGVLSDRFGRKSVLILSSLSALAALGFFAFADGYPMLVIGAILDGLAFALASGNNDALLHDTLKELGREEEYAARRGEIGFWHQVALSAAVLGGSFFVGISLSLVFQLALIPLSAALLLAFFVKEPAIRGHLQSNAYAHIGEALSLIRGNTRLNLLVSGRALTEAYWRAKTPLMPAFFLMLWPLWAIGIAKSLGHAGSALGMKSVGYFVKRYGREKMALWSEGAVFGIGTFVLAV